MKISFIIPVYNTDAYLLTRCIASIEEVTKCEKEIIIVDDGSNKNDTLELEHKLSKSENIILLQQENRGPSAARNVGVENSSGEYIVFVDSDDYLLSNNFNLILDSTKDVPSFDVLYFSHLSASGNTNNYIQCKNFSEFKATANEHNYRFDYYVIWGKIYKKTLFDKIRFDERIKYCEDLLLNLQINQLGQILVGVDVQGIIHETNETSLCHKYNPCIDKDFANTIEAFRPYIDEKEGNFYTECIFNYFYRHILPLKVFHVENNKSVFEKNREACEILFSEPYYEMFNSVRYEKLSLRRKLIYILSNLRLIWVAYFLI